MVKMQDGYNNQEITLYIRNHVGQTHTIKANKQDTCFSIKEKTAALMGDNSPEEYREFEYYTTGNRLSDNLRLIFSSKDLQDDATIASYNIQEGSTLNVIPRFGKQSYDIQIMCIANNVKFTTFIKHNSYEPCIVGELKAKLSQFTSLACTTLYLKKRGIDEFCTLENNDTAVPLKDIYAILDGDMVIEPRTDSLHLYSTSDGRIISDCNDRTDNREENRNQEDLIKSFFSLPKAESVVKLEPEHRQSLINCVGAVNAPSLKRETSNKYNFSNIIIYAACGGGAVLLAQCLPPNNSSDRNLFNVASIALIGTIAGAIIGTASNYIYERYFKSQDNTYELSNSGVNHAR
jgi:hypothetical protein